MPDISDFEPWVQDADHQRAVETYLELTPRVHAAEGYAMWSQSSPVDRGATAFGMMAAATSEKRCEDAPPVFVTTSRRGSLRLSAAVFDGMGGAGSAPVSLSSGVAVTQAFAAARAARDAIEKLWCSQLNELASGEAMQVALSEAINEQHTAYTRKTAATSGAPSRLRGSMIRHFPTTMASAQCVAEPGGHWSIRVNWAGDSRCYLLSPENGLQQLTTDDVDSDDPLDQLRSDYPLTNVIAAARSFTVHSKQVSVAGPALVLVATDGMFHYLPTPGSLEYLLLSTMRDSESQASAAVMRYAREIARDDVSYAILALGFNHFSEIGLAFRRRKTLIDGMGYGRLIGMPRGEKATLVLADELWSRERKGYTKWMKSHDN